MDQRILIARRRVEHSRRKLASERDGAKRPIAGRLLAEEEAKLAALTETVATEGWEQLLDMVARRAAELLGAEDPGMNPPESEARLASLLDRMPFGFGLTDHTGVWILANVPMRRYAPEKIPSRDPEAIQRWQAFDTEGRSLDPAFWPNARALRGETVIPGVEFIHTADDGRQTVARMAAAPVRYVDGHVGGAVCVVEELDNGLLGNCSVFDR
jgi:PAS domain-containing protein